MTRDSIITVRGLADNGRRFAHATLKRLGIPPCASCGAMPWDCTCPMSVRQANGWDHRDLAKLHGDPERNVGVHVPDAGRELLALIVELAVETDDAHALDEHAAGIRWALARAREAAKRAGLT